ncbi:MAG: bifunctional UDP-N-acetylglucosamine diphosphorylase/glucosamine-1-phosphate N-acetyltransferase GlmU [Gammaproteobacteria bacterium]|nr:bifunctional UDP-N-acetylglucosamine diphosphorylase/glucosamine-1-phosphate N-acetyltransferase GlmU [Gammaproteobacteria bacterium]
MTEVNSGIYCFPTACLSHWLSQVNANNAQKELYLTDVLGIALQEGVKVNTVLPQHNHEILGVNDRIQLALVERCYQKQRAELLMLQGVTLRDPARVDIRGELVVGQDSVIDCNVIFEDKVSIGVNCFIGSNCIIKNSVIGDGVIIKANSMIEDSVVEDHCHIGPFARIRPDSYLEQYSHVGNFVEIKKSRLGHSSKVNHLSYIGDASVGHRVNIGAGTITCNYDGVNKHQTTIGDGAFIGSGTELVAPVEVGAGAFIGAGSTITQHAPPHELTLARVKQETIKDWKRREKK